MTAALFVAIRNEEAPDNCEECRAAQENTHRPLACWFRENTSLVECPFETLSSFPGVRAVVAFCMMAIDSTEKKTEMGDTRNQYFVGLERFEFACRLYCLPFDARESLPSERLPLQDAWHGWEVASFVANRASKDNALAYVAPKPTRSPGAPGGNWKKVV